MNQIVKYASQGTLILSAAWAISFWIPNVKDGSLPEPWEGVGGCGAGGGGGGAGDGIRWLGEGVSGGRLETEILAKKSVGQNFSYSTLQTRFAYKTDAGSSWAIKAPFVSKTAEVQYRSNQGANDRTTGGLGDLSIEYGAPFGGSGALSLNGSLSLPTGQYDITRGPDAAKEILPTGLQKGSGLYGLGGGISLTKDVDAGFWSFDIGAFFPFALSFQGRNSLLYSNYADHANSKDERFQYIFKPYGENDLGDYSPPSLSMGAFYAYRGTRGYVHSFGLSMGAPLGVAWIHHEDPTRYDPRPDPDHKSWSGALVYGLEMSKSQFPLFLGFSLPIHARSSALGANEYDESPMRQWNAPDWQDFMQQWNMAVGLKGSFF